MHKTPARQVQIFLIDLSLTFAGLGLLGLGTYAVWDEKIGLAGISLTAGLVFLFSANIDRFESIKGLGIEAKIRKLDRTIVKAEVTLEQMKKISELIGINVIKFNSFIAGVGSTPTLMEAYHQSQEIKTLLRELGSDQNTINSALTPWARSAAYRLYDHLRILIVHHLQDQYSYLLHEDAASSQSAGQPTPQQRYYALIDYTTLDNYRIERHAVEITSVAQQLRNYISKSPEKLNSEHLAEVHREIDIAETQLKHLAKEMSFLDINYWEKIS